MQTNFNSAVFLKILERIMYNRLYKYLTKNNLLERIMYNRLYKYLTKNNLLFGKQFGFRKGHSTEHALTELVRLFQGK